MRRLEVCPHCCAALTYDQGGTTYSRGIEVQIRGIYDGGLFFECPDCGGRWHRWPVGDRLRDAAVPYVEGGREL